jgi:hypothetical protein
MANNELYPFYEPYTLLFSGQCLYGKGKGTTITGEGFLRKSNKVYIYGSDLKSGIFKHDGWHIVDPESVTYIAFKKSPSKKAE